MAKKSPSKTQKKTTKGILDRIFGRDDKEAGIAFQVALQKNWRDTLTKATTLQHKRAIRYSDYEAMMEDSILQSAIELYIDDALQYSKQQGAELWVSGSNKKLVKAASEFLETRNLDEIRDWCHWMTMYGDYFIRVYGEANKGVTNVTGQVHPKEVTRLSWNGYLQGYTVTSEKDKIYEPWEMLHFRLLGGNGVKMETQKGIEKEGKWVFDTAKYGTSILEPARKVYKQLTLVEDHIIIGRLSRATLTYLISIMTGDLDVDQAIKLTDLMEERLKESIVQSMGKYESATGYKREGDMVVFPVAGEKGSVQITEMGGNPNVTGVKDMDILLSRMSGAIKIPLPYLGWTDKLPGSLGEGPLLRLDIRYARTVKRVQRGTVAGLMTLLAIHFAYLGIDITGEDLQIELVEPSSAEEEERRSGLKKAMEVMSGLLDFLEQLKLTDRIDKVKFARMVLADLSTLGFSLDDFLIDAEKGKELVKPKATKGGDKDKDKEKEKEKEVFKHRVVMRKTHFHEYSKLANSINAEGDKRLMEQTEKMMKEAGLLEEAKMDRVELAKELAPVVVEEKKKEGDDGEEHSGNMDKSTDTD